MDLLLCGSIALLETLCLKATVMPDVAPSRGGELGYGFRQLLLLTSMQYVALKIYRIFIYPFWVSPFRHLPGPRVSQKLSQVPVCPPGKYTPPD